jgi:adenylate cyclase
VNVRLYLGKRTLFMTVALVLLIALVNLRAADPWPVRNLRDAYFDYLQRLAPRDYTPVPVRIVDLDEASLARHGQWPWPRDRLAALVDRLAERGAAVIVFDILFSEADRLSPRNLIKDPAVRGALTSGPWVEQIDKLDNDVAFANSMGRAAVVLGISDAGETSFASVVTKAGFAFVGQDPGQALLPLRSTTPVVPVLAAAAQGIGVVNVNPLGESDTQREVPLIWRTPSGFMPGLAVEVLRVALGESTIVVIGPNAGINRVYEVKVGGYTIPTLTNGLFPLHFRHEEPSLYIPAYQVLDPLYSQQHESAIEGAIVFVGSSAAGLADTRTTALGERVPGVSIHAQVVEQILLETYLTRTDVMQGAEIIVLILLGFLVSFVLMLTGPVPSVLVGGFAGGITLAASWYAFTRLGILFDATFPLIGGFVAFSALAMYQFAVSDREKRLIRRSFARYVAPSVMQEIDRKGHSIELGGKTGEVTVLFCDIRNFTPLAATMSAQDLVALLNELFSDLSEEILAQAGTIDKYIGDEIMAFWNAPLETPRHQFRACMATLNMRRAIALYNARKAVHGTAPVAIGMGLDCGQACVGNIGSRNRFNYTAIGETVNVAARTQSACKHVAYDILVTGEVVEAAPSLAFLPAGRIELKGVADLAKTFILVGDDDLARSDAFAQLTVGYRALLDALKTDLPCAEALAREVTVLADRIDPRLRNFINRCLQRADDFL